MKIFHQKATLPSAFSFPNPTSAILYFSKIFNSSRNFLGEQELMKIKLFIIYFEKPIKL